MMICLFFVWCWFDWFLLKLVNNDDDDDDDNVDNDDDVAIKDGENCVVLIMMTMIDHKES